MSGAVVMDGPAADARPALEALWERAPDPDAAVRGAGMPAELEQRYGGPLLIPLRQDRPTVVANFVSTLDGVVAFGGTLTGGGLVSGHHEPDRFVMGLLRALADVVVVGAGTLRGSTSERWTAEHVHPVSAADFARWRHAMALAPTPTTIVVSGSGDVPVDHPGLRDGRVPVVVATTAAGASRLGGGRLAEHVSVKSVGTGSRLTGDDVVGLAARLGARLVLTEGGPHVLGELVGSDLVDELFLTVAPQLVGRGGGERLGLVEGLALPPVEGRWHELRSVRRSTDHLFLRYARRAGQTQAQES